MSPNFESLPPELQLNILSYLPIPSLLAFSQTSRTSHALATTSLRTLSLGIYPNRLSSLISRLSNNSSTCQPSRQPDAATSHGSASAADTKPLHRGKSKHARPTAPDWANNTISMTIPAANKLSTPTLLSFHTSLTVALLKRYAPALRHLDLSVWTLTPQIAAALAGIKNLRTLSIRIENPFSRRGVLTCGGGPAWNMLAGKFGRLERLRIEGADITEWQLERILEANTSVRELYVRRCPRVGKGLWQYLAEEWGYGENLWGLGHISCRHLDDEIYEWARMLRGLEFLSLHGCTYLRNDDIKRENEIWGIPEIIMPQAIDDQGYPNMIEVDPAYASPNSDTDEEDLVLAY
ncbi:hypothetical protein BDY21DRAFT_331523 [Lineolata rhizophorae]|uniref:F-box domain-containing protein n=1 Tax=Lineolata rhizophorae TaxID=578093 RepID=A0A6A6PB96_9PEZI|nr:hypothetical protein BDY21DRAFT_331523 [Lineolata rhizophorae]